MTEDLGVTPSTVSGPTLRDVPAIRTLDAGEPISCGMRVTVRGTDSGPRAYRTEQSERHHFIAAADSTPHMKVDVL